MWPAMVILARNMQARNQTGAMHKVARKSCHPLEIEIPKATIAMLKVKVTCPDFTPIAFFKDSVSVWIFEGSSMKFVVSK